MKGPAGWLAVVAVVVCLAAPGHALHCNGETITITIPGATLYIDDRSDESGEINHWFYLESNGVEGLQSGGFQCIDLECNTTLSDTCAHTNPDTLIL